MRRVRRRRSADGAVVRAAVALVGLALTIGATSAALAAGTQADPEGRATAPPNPQGLYLRDCAVCHGSDGRGTNRGPTLVGVGRASVDYYLTTGRMPLVDVGRTNAPDRKLQPLPDRTLGDPDAVPHRHEPAYGPPAIQGLVDYIEALTGGGGPDIPTVAGGGKITDGGELFRLQCAACHSSTGEGGALEHREAPTTHPANERQIAEAVRVGPGLMPAFGNAALTDEQLASVVTYVRYLAKPSDRGGNPLSHLGPFAEGIVAFAGLAALVVATRWIGERG